MRTDGCATATSPPAMSIDGTPQPANQNELSAIAVRVQQHAQFAFVDVYSGLELRSEQDRIRVYRKPSSEFDAWLVRDFAGDCVEVVDAEYAARDLQALATRIADDMTYWNSNGVPINSVGPKVDGSGVEVTTSGDIEQARSELAQRYGEDAPIIVGYGSPIVPAADLATP